jgi:hypothetical protein
MENVTPAMLFQLLFTVLIIAIIARWWENIQAWGLRLMSRYQGPGDAPEEVQDEDITAVLNEPNEPANGGSGAFRRGEPSGTQGSVLNLTANEVRAVQVIILRREREAMQGRKLSKSKAIMAAFGVKRGGTSTYERASEIYDALFTQPKSTRYITLDEHRQPVMEDAS